MLYVRVEEESKEHLRAPTVISLHPWLPLLSGLSSLTLAGFSGWLAYSAWEDGHFAFISDGIAKECGFTAVVMGICGTLLSIAMLVAGAHAGSGTLVFLSVVFALSWHAMLGVANTGWNVHYAALGVLMLDVTCFHVWIVLLPPWNRMPLGPLHRLCIGASIVFGAGFCVSAISRRASGDMVGTESYNMVYSLGCLMEYAMVAFMTGANMCLSIGLDVCLNVHLVFVDQDF